MKRIAAWVTWGAVLLAATFVMYQSRDDVDQAHVALTYLLVVLGGSMSGGRSLGLVLACSGFVLLDFFFQLPYDTLAVGKPLDWVVLLVFLATAAVTTHLLTLARSEAAEARQRADEIASLARLGSETLNEARAESALSAIAAVIRQTVRAEECDILQWDGSRLSPGAHASSSVEAPTDGALLRWVAERGRTATVDQRGTVRRAELQPTDVDAIGLDTRTARVVILPLQAHGRTVGVLRVASPGVLIADDGKRRFLSALAFYAALAVERHRLAAEAEHVKALREADDLKDIVLASLSHDLRTPLTTIKALAQDSALRGDENAAVIEEEADRLSRFVGDLLDLSRLKGGVLPVTPELNTAEDLVGAAIRQVRGLLNGRSIEPKLDPSAPALVGHFDFVQSLRILNNLLENALRYAPPGSTVEVAIQRDNGHLEFSVADRGPGIAPSEREHIFELFYRASDSPPDAGRAGLGLAIARRLAEIQGGSLQFEPRPGGGSIFVVRLPAVDVLAES